jgi:hypothetical protein
MRPIMRSAAPALAPGGHHPRRGHYATVVDRVDVESRIARRTHSLARTAPARGAL